MQFPADGQLIFVAFDQEINSGALTECTHP